MNEMSIFLSKPQRSTKSSKKNRKTAGTKATLHNSELENDYQLYKVNPNSHGLAHKIMNPNFEKQKTQLTTLF